MSTKQFAVLVIVAAAFSLLGGVLSNNALPGRSAYAEDSRRRGPARVIQAEQFQLLDRDGKIRVSMASLADGSAGLSVYDENGLTRAGLGVGPNDAPRLTLRDGNRELRATLALGMDGTPVMCLYDRKGELRAQVSLKRSGEPAVILCDRRGKPIWFAPR